MAAAIINYVAVDHPAASGTTTACKNVKVGGRRRHPYTGNHLRCGIPEPSTCSSTSSHPRAPQGKESITRRGTILSSFVLGMGMAAAAVVPPNATATAESFPWGSRSYIQERYFQPKMSPEDAVSRIQQTAEGMHAVRQMLDAMAWRYVLRYTRLKMAYLSDDLNNALVLLPQNRRLAYINAANQLLDNISQLDRYLSTPKVYESYVYYEKTLKSLDDVVATFA